MSHVVRHETLRSGSQQFLRRGCGRRFVVDPKKGPVIEERKDLIRRLRLVNHDDPGRRNVARQVVAMVAGDRSEFTVWCLWHSLPDESRSGAVVSSDFWSTYSAVTLAARRVWQR